MGWMDGRDWYTPGTITVYPYASGPSLSCSFMHLRQSRPS